MLLESSPSLWPPVPLPGQGHLREAGYQGPGYRTVFTEVVDICHPRPRDVRGVKGSGVQLQ